jgi:hypothetical protein
MTRGPHAGYEGDRGLLRESLAALVLLAVVVGGVYLGVLGWRG